MPNFELIFDKVLRVWRGKKIFGSLGTFRRVIVAPNLDLAKKIGGAMEGEQLNDIPGWEIMRYFPENEEIKFNEEYEVGLGSLSSVIETIAEPTLGEMLHPIPNCSFIWDRVVQKLGWWWYKGVAVEFYAVQKSYSAHETITIDGVLVKNNTHPFVCGLTLGVVAVHEGKEFNSNEDAQRFLMSIRAAK
ncbi:MAG: hypothetical protein HYX20_04140 [Candidatus Yanofskybacteria bacterium]|nr:hypothetical protein [Candidatus Yanofskybacteria bacterium]